MHAPSSVLLPLAMVHEGSNTRRFFAEAALAELAASIKARGVESPIFVRPRPDGSFEVVAGFRRRRAALLAGLTHVPAFVREFTDAEALELNLVENLQRADPHPLDEADGFRDLQSKFGYSVDVIAAKTGKPPSHIYKRLQLLRLAKPARTAYLAGKLLDGVALLLATIPDAKQQADAAASLTAHRDPTGINAARDFIDRSFRLRLQGAPFPIADAALVPGTPSCNACPKRTGNAPQLFDDASPKDLCTDRACFQRKADAGWVLIAEKALAKGHDVLDEEQSANLFRHGSYLAHGSPYVDLANYCPGESTGRTWGAVLGRYSPPLVVARDPDGTAHQLVRAEDAKELLTHIRGTQAEDATDDARAKAKDVRQEQRQRRLTFSRALTTVATKAAEEGPSDALLRFLAHETISSAPFDTRRTVATLRGHEGSPYDAIAALSGSVDTMTGPEALGLVTQILASRWAFASHVRDLPPALAHAAEVLSIDMAQLHVDVAAEEAARAKTKKDGAPCPRCQHTAKRFVITTSGPLCSKCHKATVQSAAVEAALTEDAAEAA